MEAAGILISDMFEMLGELIINITPVDKELANHGGLVLEKLQEFDSKLKSGLDDIKDFSSSELLSEFIQKAESLDANLKFILKMMTKKAVHLDKIIAEKGGEAECH